MFQSIKGRRLAGGVSALALAASVVAISAVGGSSADASITARCTINGQATVCYPLDRNSVASDQIVNYSIGANDLNKNLYAALLGVPANGINSTTQVKDGTITEPDLAKAVQDKLNDKGPAYLKHWGTISRNVIGNADAELATTSTAAPAGDGALHIHAASAADAVSWGNEVDFKDMAVKDLLPIGFSVYTTGENSALGNNMPKIVFEIDPNVAAVNSNYASLVYLPENGTANTWTNFNATADTGKHWGLSGSLFNGTPCSLNGARCTWNEMMEYLNDGGDPATVLTAGVGHGRDYAGSWDVDLLKFGGKTYDFEPGGVLVK
jgi:hypothetical protein